MTRTAGPNDALPMTRRQLTTKQLERQFVQLCNNHEATSTKYHRDRLFIRFRAWIAQRQLQLTLASAALFALQHATKATSKANYFAALKARIHPKTWIEQFQLALRRRSALEHLKQAEVITWAQFKVILRDANNADTRRTALFLWYTASRTSDVEQLRREDITIVNDAIAIVWKHIKTAQTASRHFADQFFTLLQKPQDATWFDDMITYLNSLPPKALVCSQVSLTAISRLLVANRLSDHSIKRSSLTAKAERLVRQITAQPPGITRELLKQNAKETLRIMAKHAAWNSTLRYLGRPDLAAALNPAI